MRLITVAHGTASEDAFVACNDGRLTPHTPAERVRREGDLLVYDSGRRTLAE